ncbi:MAG: hypothetical protein V4590_09615 [Bacteroidota bacterium]
MSNAKEIQLAFLQKVKSTLSETVSFVDELADLLGTSTDSTYRRLRGETFLGIDEIAAICAHFKVPFDSESKRSGETVTFSFNRLRDRKDGFADWLEAMSADVKRIASINDSNILYAADDVPPWHHFNNDELICFKIFYWQKSILNTPELQNKDFDTSLIPAQLISQAKEMLKDYNQVTSAEIWTEDTLNSTLKQIEYFWESGFFQSKEVAIRMCDHIDAEIDLLKLKAEKQSKLVGDNESGAENFSLYQSEVMVGNNSILVTLGKHKKMAYVSNNTFNMMSTFDPGFITENELWLKNLMNKSILISGVNEKQRNRFFKVLKEKIEAQRNRIK